MRIAIVAPSQVPYVKGGAERLWRGLHQALEDAGHLCELFNVPSPDGDFWQIIDTYRKFTRMDFGSFDVLVTGKNPAWMIPHPNHYVYMLHPLRGVYDTYDLFGLPKEVVTRNLLVQAIAESCDAGIETAELFSMLDELRQERAFTAEETALPSPLLRKVVHRLDANAFASVRKISAISKTVASRDEYFHGRRDVKAFYPVSEVRGEARRPGEHFLAYSRLDAAKRIDLIIEGYRKAELDTPLIIAGEGPESENLRQLAADDQRIKFVGRVSDQELTELISKSRAVAFTPLMEDYGYVTAEALSSGRPVITVSDAGGPTEFVIDDQNGWLSGPSPEGLANSFKRADAYSDWKQKRTRCKESVRSVRWQPLITDITKTSRSRRIVSGVRRKKLVSMSTYPIAPPQGGGQARVFYLNRALSDAFDVEVVCLADASSEYERLQPSENFVVHNVPASQSFAEFDWSYYQRSRVPTTDIAFSVNYGANDAYVSRCEESIASADVLIAEQCYTFPLANQLRNGKPVIYNSQNVELDLKAQMFAESEVRQELLDWTRNSEHLALTQAHLVVHCSEADSARAATVYDFAPPFEVLVENGTDTASIQYRSLAERNHIRRQLGLSSGYCLFLASWHEPNIQACEALFELARELPGITFCVAGTVGEYFRGKAADGDRFWPANVLITGRISESERLALMMGASCAINPMSSGSGTNIKMLDYLAAGLPVLSTSVGARGLESIGDLVERAEIGDFADKILPLMNRAPSITARRRVAESFDWRALGAAYAKNIKKLLRV